MSDNESSVPQLFTGDSVALQASADAAAVARATQEIQAALVIAKRFPRDEIKSKAKIIKACQRKELAEIAEYEYPRGGKRITGPTVDLLRAIANRWGNVRYGWTELDRRDGQSMVRVFAWDLETNGQAERTFSVKHIRDTQGGGYALEDERDIYELLANMAARRVRACLQEVIDQDVIDEAIDQCRRTLKDGEKTPLQDRLVHMVNAFSELGVTQTMIEGRLGHALSAVSENQFAQLRRIYKSLKDGIGKREDYFKAQTAKPDFEAGGSENNSQICSEPTAMAGQPASTPSPAPSNPPAQPPSQPPAASKPAPMLTAVRKLCKAGGISEGKVLALCYEIGLSDGSATSLEELQITAPSALQKINDEWMQGIADRLRGMK